MENKTKVKDVFTAWGGVLKALFGKQEDNEMLNDLGIKKGIISGIGYLIWLGFVLPANILKFILTPKWAWVHFTQRHLISPLFELEALTGSESPSRLLGEIYENNLNYFKSKEDSGIKTSHLKPDIKTLERIMIFAKFRMILTLLIFTVGAYALYQFFQEVVSLISMLATSVIALFGISYGGFDGLLGTGFMSGIGGYIIYTLGGALIVYMVMVSVRFLNQAIRSIMFADKKLLQDFVDDSLHYTITKSIEIYGKETALKAYDLLLKNVVIDTNIYKKTDPFYKQLEKPEPDEINDFLDNEDERS